jgi:hypothetical protein
LQLVRASTVILGSEPHGTHDHILDLSPSTLISVWLSGKLHLALASTVILGSEPHGTHDHILDFSPSTLISVWLSGKLQLALASTVILGSEPHETHDPILLSDGSGSLQTTTLQQEQCLGCSLYRIVANCQGNTELNNALTGEYCYLLGYNAV